MFGSSSANRGPSVDEMVQRAMQATAWGQWGDESMFGGTWSGNNVTNMSSLQLLAVYGCVRFICEGISTMPVDVFSEDAEGKRQERNKPPWLENPTPDLDFIAWCTQVLTSLLLAGNAYCRMEFTGALGNAIQRLTPLDPDTVKVSREQGRKTYRIKGLAVDPRSMLHIPGFMFPGSDVGVSPVEAARQSVGAGLAVEEFAARFFGQGANLGGVIEDPGPVDPDKARDMSKGWARLHGGNKRAHMPGVLQGGAVWKPTGVTNEQAQFLETRQFSIAQIASHMFLIDPSEFGFSGQRGSSLTYANLEQRNARKVQVTFLPWIVRLETALSKLLAQPRFVKFNVNGLLRGDTKTRYETYKIASDINTAAAAVGEPPILSTSEMRDYEDLEPWEGEVPQPPAPVVVAPPAADAEPVAASMPSITVNNHLPEPRNEINVAAADAPVVNVAAPDVHVDVAPADVRVDVAAPSVAVRNVVDPTPVSVTVEPAPPRSRNVERDTEGNITRVVEE